MTAARSDLMALAAKLRMWPAADGADGRSSSYIESLMQEAADAFDRLAASQPDRSKNWTLVDGTMTTGESIIFEGSFIVAKVTRREDAEFILSLLSGAGTKSDDDTPRCVCCGKPAIGKCEGSPEPDWKQDQAETSRIKPRPSAPSPGPDVSLPPPVGEPVAFITKSGFKNWLQGDGPENHVLLRTGGDLRVALYTHPVAWECVAQRQSLPEPADCDWPVCGCDPHANKVIESLEEQGVLSTHPPAPAVGPDVREALEALVRDCMASDFNEHWESFKNAEAALTRPLGGFVQEETPLTKQESSGAIRSEIETTLWRHKQRGTVYRVLHNNVPMQENRTKGRALDDEPMVVYQDVGSGAVYVRPVVEMWDGRFEAVAEKDADAQRDDGLLSGVSADPT